MEAKHVALLDAHAGQALIVKNLALLGIGNVLIADMDVIENSNLSRSVLYRQSNNGQFKAETAARAAAREAGTEFIKLSADAAGAFAAALKAHREKVIAKMVSDGIKNAGAVYSALQA